VPKGYVIITEDIKDPAGMAEYAKLAGKAMAGSKLLSFDQKPEVLEGRWHGSQTVVLEFGSVSLSPKLTFGRKSASRSRQNVDFGGD